MNEHEKSLKLAELMGWRKYPHSPDMKRGLSYSVRGVDGMPSASIVELEPYAATPIGRVQFAAILLRFPEVFELFMETSLVIPHVKLRLEQPRQAAILDAILKMNGVDIGPVLNNQ